MMLLLCYVSFSVSTTTGPNSYNDRMKGFELNTNGEYYYVDFTKELNLKALKLLEPPTKWIRSNDCLEEGYLPETTTLL